MLIELFLNIYGIVSLFDRFAQFFFEFHTKTQFLIDHQIEVVADGLNFRVIHVDLLKVPYIFDEEPLDRENRNTLPGCAINLLTF